MSRQNKKPRENPVDALKKIRIIYPHLKHLHELVLECQEDSRDADEPQCIALHGPTGAGKSTFVKYYASKFPSVETPSGLHIPVFYCLCPSKITTKGLAEEILRQLGDPLWAVGTLNQMTIRLKGLLKNCGAELIIFDDFHQLLNSNSMFILQEVSDWLKNLIKDTNVPFVVVGLEGEVEALLNFNSQLARLFDYRESILPFQWNPSDPMTLKAFDNLIKSFEQAAGVNLTTEVSRMELLANLHYATDGVMANIMKLLRNSARVVLKENGNVITCSVLADVFDRRLAKRLKNKINPFLQNQVASLPLIPSNTQAPATLPASTRTRRPSRSKSPRNTLIPKVNDPQPDARGVNSVQGDQTEPW